MKTCCVKSFFNSIEWYFYIQHCVKSVRIWSFSAPYFPTFGLNTERNDAEKYIAIAAKCRTEKLRIQTLFTQCKRSRKAPYAEKCTANKSVDIWCLVKMHSSQVIFNALPNIKQHRHWRLAGKTLCEKCQNTEFFWSVISRIWTEYGKVRTRKTPYSDKFYTVKVLVVKVSKQFW